MILRGPGRADNGLYGRAFGREVARVIHKNGGSLGGVLSCAAFPGHGTSTHRPCHHGVTPESSTAGSAQYPIDWVSVKLSVMPTVHRFDAYRVVIYTNDHRPAHVHVVGPPGRAIFELNCPTGPPMVRDSRLKPTELAKIKTVLQQHLAELCAAWGSIHGHS